MITTNNTQPLIICSIDDLRQIISECIQSNNYANENKTNEDKYLNTAQVTELLHCDRSTLWRWNKEGILPTIKMGKNNLYRESTIKEIISRNEK